MAANGYSNVMLYMVTANPYDRRRLVVVCQSCILRRELSEHMQYITAILRLDQSRGGGVGNPKKEGS